MLQIKESGPIPTKMETVGETFHLYLKKLKYMIQRANHIPDIMEKRSELWWIKMMDLE